MQILNLRYFLLLFLTCAAPALSQTGVTIVDQNNQPLPNAVIEYTPLQTTHLSTTQSLEEQIYVMDQINKEFEPHVLIIPENSLVSFPNSDDIRHHVYSFSPAKKFELKLYAGKPKSPVRFNKTGVVVMGCNIHDSMIGYIYVSANNNTLISDIKGEVLLPHNLIQQSELKIWHPNSAIGISKHTTFTINQAMLDQKNIVLKITINEPEARDSFENLNTHEH